MSTAVVYSRATVGVAAPLVTVEVHLSNGLPGLAMVGLAETAGKDSRDRVRSALLNSGFEFPARRITVNLAPADLRKDGAGFDLPIALGILAASGQLPGDALATCEFLGELALTGALRSVRGALPAMLAAAAAGRALVLPVVNGEEAAHARRGSALPARHLLEVCAHFAGGARLLPAPAPDLIADTDLSPHQDLSDIRGQAAAKRSLEIAAAGGHNLLMVGPPGTGKSTLASRLPALLPALGDDDALVAASIRSLDGQPFDTRQWRRPPFRAPHHTASAAALVGGGRRPKPGEASLAHAGVLFLDELPEFRREALEALREPMGSGQVTVSRAAERVEYPARFQLIAAMNPCPCGALGDPGALCRCAPEVVRRYLGRLSGPLLDRIDLHVDVPRVAEGALLDPAATPESAAVRARVVTARARQQARQGRLNAALLPRDIHTVCALDGAARSLLQQAAARYRLSARGVHSVIKVARTLADLVARAEISSDDLCEALAQRRIERLAQAS